VNSPVAFTVPAEIPPVTVPLLPNVVAPDPLKLAKVTVPVVALKLSALVAVLALLTAPRVWPELAKSAKPLAPSVSALPLARLPALPIAKVPALTVVKPV
jgi:hypothetical protein